MPVSTTPLSYPLINGMKHDYSSVEISIDGAKFIGVKEISYKHSLEPGEVRGTRSQLLGRTRGKYSAEGSMTLYLSEYQDLIAKLAAKGIGYLEQDFDVEVSYSGRNTDLVTDRLRGCRIKSADKSHSSGEEALVVKCDLHVMYLLESDKTPLDPKQMLK